jgi:transcriptional antiterminator RfaH
VRTLGRYAAKGSDMPILDREVSHYPSALLDNGPDVTSQRKWWAVFTKARQEKALARHLLRREIPFYLPLVPRDHLIRGRRVHSFVPLFSGYVFLHGTEEERVQSLTTNRVSCILPVPDEAQLWQDLRQVHRLIEADAPLTVERRLTAGRQVRIKAGAMMGMEGTVLARRGSIRLLVAVHFLQAGVSVEIDDYMLEAID